MSQFTQLTIGILALQGGYARHAAMLQDLGCQTKLIKKQEELESIDGLILPGGESTTIGMLAQRFGLLPSIQKKITAGLPVFGTCAGLILLADTIEGSDQAHFGGLAISVRRNAYGTQKDSFETDLQIQVDNETWNIRGVFIRAPQVIKTAKGTEILCRYEDLPVLLRQNNILAASFHPELTENNSLHRFFLSKMVIPSKNT